MKRRINYLSLISLPFLLLILVNTFSPQPGSLKDANKCSRYCHNKGCVHFEKKMNRENSSFLSTGAFRFYRWNISALKNNFLGLSYRDMNLFLYVIFLPGIMIILCWTGFKNKT
jgi:hypothetical protein